MAVLTDHDNDLFNRIGWSMIDIENEIIAIRSHQIDDISTYIVAAQHGGHITANIAVINMLIGKLDDETFKYQLSNAIRLDELNKLDARPEHYISESVCIFERRWFTHEFWGNIREQYVETGVIDTDKME